MTAEIIQHRQTSYTIWHSHVLICCRTDLHSPRIIRGSQFSNIQTFVCLTTPLNSCPRSLRPSWVWHWYVSFCKLSVLTSIMMHNLHKSKSRIIIGNTMIPQFVLIPLEQVVSILSCVSSEPIIIPFISQINYTNTLLSMLRWTILY